MPVSAHAAILMRPTATVILAALVAIPFSGTVSGAGTELLKGQPRAGYFQVRLQRKDLVLNPEERFKLILQVPDATGKALARPASALVRMTTDPGHKELYSKIFQANARNPSHIDVELTAPSNQGVYSIWLGRKNRPESQRLQFIVVDAEPMEKAANIAARPELIQSVDLGADLGTDRLRSDGTGGVVLSKDYGAYRITGRRAEKAYGKPDPDKTLNWFAVRMHTPYPLRPHWLEIHYPNEGDRAFVVSIIDHNGGSKYRNTTDYLLTTKPEKPEKIRVARLLVWPRSEEFAVAFFNAKNGTGAAVKQVNLYSAPSSVEPSPLRAACKRLGILFEEPIFGRTLGGPRLAERPRSARTRSDWRTFLVAGENLLHAMNMAGYDEVLLPVYAYGATLYPSRHIDSRSRYDNDAKFRRRFDPVQKDIVRLLLRLFEKEGKRFSPLFMFYGKVPEFEQRLKQGGTPLDLVRRDGRHLRELAPRGWAAPIYDPLNPEVQGWAHSVLSEFMERYGDSPALGDVGLTFNTSSWIQYPGPDWGFGEATRRRFIDSLGDSSDITPPPPQAPRFVQWLSTNRLEQRWSSWRNDSLAAWYGELADMVRQGNPSRRLIAAFLNIFSSRHASEPPRYDGVTTETLRGYLRGLGLESLLTGARPDIRILRPVRLPVAGHKRSEQLSRVSRSSAAAELFSSIRNHGVLIWHSYYESYVDDIRTRLWWPAGVKIVAQQFDAEALPQPPEDGWPLCYDGGWQMPQY